MALFLPITKVDAKARLVYGTLTEEVPDKTGEILDYESAKPAFAHWSEQFRLATNGKSLGNVRAMHGAVAAGKFTDIVFDDVQKRIQGVAKIIDEEEWRKVLEGVYTGFSIGGGYARRWQDAENPELMRYTPTLSEVSLVDNPAVPSATFELVRGDGKSELKKFNSANESQEGVPMVRGTVEVQNTAGSETDTQDEDLRVAQLIKDLGWLCDEVEADGDDDIAAHIHSVLDYLSDEEDAPEENQDETPSYQKYASELASVPPLRKREMMGDKRLEKRLGTMALTLEKLASRLERIEAQPMPVRGSVRAVEKSSGVSAEDVLQALPPMERVHALMKQALANPVQA